MSRHTRRNFLQRIFEKSMPRNNRGSGLVEIIVSMLLLAIIVVPMLNMFTTSSRINTKSRQQQYATAVAENVMEEIRAGNHPISSCTEDIAAAEGTSRYTKTVGGLLQGTGTFRAEIVYDSAPYISSDFNSYPMPEITTFGEDNTVIVSVDFTEQEPEIADFFLMMHETAVEILNDAAETAAMELYWYDWTVWEATVARWDIEHPGETPPAEPLIEDEKYQYTKVIPLTLAELTAKLHRETTLTFHKEMVGSAAMCQVLASVRYTLPADVNVGQTAGEEGVYETGFFASDYLAIEKMNYVYLLYCPFDVTDSTREDVVINAEEVHTDTAFECRLLVVPQTEEAAYTLNLTVLMSSRIPENSNRLEILCQTRIENQWKTSADATSWIAYPVVDKLVPELSATDKVYQVTVKIYTQTGTDLLAEAETTVYEKNK